MYVRKSRNNTRSGKRRVYRKKPRNMLRSRYKARIPTAPAQRSRMLKLQYQQVNTLTSTAGSIASILFRINDLVDPYYTGVGHQSLYRDQMYSLYEYGRVVAASIQVSCCTPNGNTVFKVVLQAATSGLTDNDMNTASERTGAITRLVQGYNGQYPMKIYSTCDRYFGLRRYTTQHDSVYRQANTSVSNIGDANSMWYMILANDLTAGASSNLVVNVKICQYTIFEEPLQVSGS